MNEPTRPDHEALDADVNYASYLKIAELLSIQQRRSIDEATGEPEHDELQDGVTRTPLASRG